MDKSTAFLNHDIYLNHLSPDKVAPFEIARNSYLAILGVRLLWALITLLIEKHASDRHMGRSYLYPR